MNRSKRLGTSWESELVAYLKPYWPTAERRALAGSADRGDIAGVAGVVIEAKNCQQIALSTWLDETEIERQNAGATYGICVVKRRRKAVGEAYCVLPLRKMVELLRQAGL